MYDDIFRWQHARGAGKHNRKKKYCGIKKSIDTFLQLIASGAFEITLNDVPVWSKLQTGRIPAPQELFQIIDSHLMLSKQVPDFGDMSR